MNEIAAGWFGDQVRGIVRTIELAGIVAIMGGGLVASALFVPAIIGTVALNPTEAGAVALGLIVVIRTLLSFSLEMEINGHWPWEESRLKAGRKERA